MSTTTTFSRSGKILRERLCREICKLLLVICNTIPLPVVVGSNVEEVEVVVAGVGYHRVHPGRLVREVGQSEIP